MQLQDYLAKHPKKYLIFDFDETIAQVNVDWSKYLARMAKVYEQFETDRQHPAFLEYTGYNYFVKKYGSEVISLARTANQKYEQEMSSGFTPYPELIEFIKNADDYKMFIYSSNSRVTVLKGLKELGIEKLFKKIVTRNETTYLKPDPDGFNLIYDPAISQKEYLMIGNSYADREMAETVGIDFFLVEFFRPIF